MQTLTELFGLGDNIGTVHNQTIGGFEHGSNTSRHDKRLKMPPDSNFIEAEWQKRVSQALRSLHCMILTAAPAAGKTKPIINGYYSNLKPSLLNRNLDKKSINFPRILFVTPRTQLAVQMLDDFVNDVVIKAVIEAEKYANTKTFTQKQQDEIAATIKSDWATAISGPSGNVSQLKSKTFRMKPIVTATYNHAENVIKEAGKFYRYIVIDELQEYLPNPGKPIDIDPGQTQSLINIVDHGMRKPNVLVLATGSVHLKPLIELQQFLQNKYNRKVDMRGSFTQSNRSQLTLVPFTEMRNSSELSDLIHKLASSGSKGNLIITFAKKEKPLSQLSIISTAQEAIKHLPVVNKQWLISTQSKDRTPKQLKDYNKTNPVSPGAFDENDPTSLLFFSLDKTMEARPNEHTASGIIAKSDPNNLLYQSILRGIGFIVGGMEDDHKRVIQSLFRAGKLHTLLASDAVGVGANVLASRLFLPNLHKFESGTFGTVNDSNLIQLLNRAGRDVGHIPFAAVYIQPKDIDVARRLLNTAPIVAAGEIDIDVVLDRFGGIGDIFTAKQKVMAIFDKAFNRASASAKTFSNIFK